MRNKFIIIILICFLVIGSLLFFTPISINDEPVEVKFLFMAYACGDCYPQYRIETIEPIDSSLNEFLKKEVRIVFSSSAQEKMVNEKASGCMICSEFFFTGYLKKSFYRGLFFKVEKAKVHVYESCCSN